jgi:hypothetical protein
LSPATRRRVCDGLDSDCNATADDGLGLGTACASGLGACAEQGVYACDGLGGVECDAVAGAPGVEACDLIDNDCDGVADDGADCRLRPNVMLCGSSSRDVATFVPPGSGLVVVNSCAPDAATQALFITRDGTIDTTVLQNYLSAGGNVITEYSISHAVFNQTFGTAIVQPAGRLGSCLDNVMTAVQFGSTDRFWQENIFAAAASTSCGYDLDNLPGITALGGWDDSSVGLAYRDYGGATLARRADWEDGQVELTDGSRDLCATWSVACPRGTVRTHALREQLRDVSVFIPPGATICGGRLHPRREHPGAPRDHDGAADADAHAGSRPAVT